MQASEFKKNFRVKLDYSSVFLGTISGFFFYTNVQACRMGLAQFQTNYGLR